MKGYGTTTAPVFAGIKYDLDQLLLRFKETGSTRFRHFSEVFRDMEMSLIFSGRQSAAELVEFSERLLQMAAAFMMPTRNYAKSTALQASFASSMDEPQTQLSTTERIFGVYACYAFYYLQPVEYVVQIRMSPAQMHEMTRLMEEVLMPEKHLDTVACLFKLVDDSAFKIVAFETCFDPICHKRYDMPDMDEDCTDEVPQPFQIASSMIDDPVLKQIAILHNKYEQGKRDLGVNSVNITRVDTMEVLHRSYKEVKTKFEEQRVRNHERIEEDITAMMKDPRTGMLMDADRTKGDIKSKAYQARIRHSRNRRYADPNMAGNFANLEPILIEDVIASSNADTTPAKGRRGRKKRKSMRADGENAEEHRIEDIEALNTDDISTPLTPSVPAKRGRPKKDQSESAQKPTEKKSIEKKPAEKKSIEKKANEKKAVSKIPFDGTDDPSATEITPRRGRAKKSELAMLEKSEQSLAEAVGELDNPIEKEIVEKKRLRRRPVLDDAFEASMRKFAETPEERAAEKKLAKLLSKK